MSDTTMGTGNTDDKQDHWDRTQDEKTREATLRLTEEFDQFMKQHKQTRQFVEVEVKSDEYKSISINFSWVASLIKLQSFHGWTQSNGRFDDKLSGEELGCTCIDTYHSLSIFQSLFTFRLRSTLYVCMPKKSPMSD